MRTFNLLKDIEFNEDQAHAESLHSNEEGRALRFAYLPNQQIENFSSRTSAAHLIILEGKGVFTSKNGEEQECGRGMMVVFDKDEEHTIRALDEKLVYIAIYDENPNPYESEHRKMLEKEGYPKEE